MWDDPRHQNDDEEHQRAEQFKQQQMSRRQRQVGPRLPAAGITPEQVAEEVPIKIKPADDGADEIFRLFQPLKPADQPVADGVILQVEQRRNHRSFPGGNGAAAGAAGLVSLVARKKISSRLVSPGCSENFRVTSSSVPSIIFCPFFKIRRREQISPTRCNRCELMMMAAPSRARFRIESFIRRMPSGSSPVNGSSK